MRVAVADINASMELLSPVLLLCRVREWGSKRGPDEVERDVGVKARTPRLFAVGACVANL